MFELLLVHGFSAGDKAGKWARRAGPARPL